MECVHALRSHWCNVRSLITICIVELDCTKELGRVIEVVEERIPPSHNEVKLSGGWMPDVIREGNGRH